MNRHDPTGKKRGAVDEAAKAISGDRSIIIDHIYQVAIDPERFETLLDLWEEKIAPHRHEGRLREDAPLFADIEIEIHAERAGMVLDRVDGRTRADLLNSVVAATDPSAAFILDHSLKFAAVNAAAEKVFGTQIGQSINDLAFDPEQIAELRKKAKEIARKKHGNTSLIRFGSSENRNTIVFRMRRLNLPNLEGNFVLVVSSELAWPEALGPTMQEAFGLTPAEAEIVRALTEGISLKEIAKLRSRSLATVKTQLRSALAKTDTHTQSELVRITLGLMDVVTATETVAGREPAKKQASPALESKEFITLKRPGNRVADHLVLGDPNGRPLLYQHFDFGLTRLPAEAEAYARENAIRIIVPVRPGFGHTTDAAHRNKTIETVIGDIVAVMDHYNIKKCPLLSMGGDAFFACNFAKARPERATAILNAGAGFPMNRPGQYERMEKWHRFVLANARYAPKILPFIVKAGFSLAGRIGKRGFLRAIYANSPADMAVTQNPDLFEAMLAGSDICLSDWHSAHKAYSNEIILKQVDWSDLITECTVPIHVWHGDDDPQVPPQTMAENMVDFPQVNFHKLENAGQLLLYSHWRDIFEQAENYL